MTSVVPPAPSSTPAPRPSVPAPLPDIKPSPPILTHSTSAGGLVGAGHHPENKPPRLDELDAVKGGISEANRATPPPLVGSENISPTTGVSTGVVVAATPPAPSPIHAPTAPPTKKVKGSRKSSSKATRANQQLPQAPPAELHPPPATTPTVAATPTPVVVQGLQREVLERKESESSLRSTDSCESTASSSADRSEDKEECESIVPQATPTIGKEGEVVPPTKLKPHPLPLAKEPNTGQTVHVPETTPQSQPPEMLSVASPTNEEEGRKEAGQGGGVGKGKSKRKLRQLKKEEKSRKKERERAARGRAGAVEKQASIPEQQPQQQSSQQHQQQSSQQQAEETDAKPSKPRSLHSPTKPEQQQLGGQRGRRGAAKSHHPHHQHQEVAAADSSLSAELNPPSFSAHKGNSDVTESTGERDPSPSPPPQPPSSVSSSSSSKLVPTSAIKNSCSVGVAGGGAVHSTSKLQYDELISDPFSRNPDRSTYARKKTSSKKQSMTAPDKASKPHLLAVGGEEDEAEPVGKQAEPGGEEGVFEAKDLEEEEVRVLEASDESLGDEADSSVTTSPEEAAELSDISAGLKHREQQRGATGAGGAGVVTPHDLAASVLSKMNAKKPRSERGRSAEGPEYEEEKELLLVKQDGGVVIKPSVMMVMPPVVVGGGDEGVKPSRPDTLLQPLQNTAVSTPSPPLPGPGSSNSSSSGSGEQLKTPSSLSLNAEPFYPSSNFKARKHGKGGGAQQRQEPGGAGGKKGGGARTAPDRNKDLKEVVAREGGGGRMGQGSAKPLPSQRVGRTATPPTAGMLEGATSPPGMAPIEKTEYYHHQQQQQQRGDKPATPSPPFPYGDPSAYRYGTGGDLLFDPQEAGVVGGDYRGSSGGGGNRMQQERDTPPHFGPPGAEEAMLLSMQERARRDPAFMMEHAYLMKAAAAAGGGGSRMVPPPPPPPLGGGPHRMSGGSGNGGSLSSLYLQQQQKYQQHPGYPPQPPPNYHHHLHHHGDAPPSNLRLQQMEEDFRRQQFLRKRKLILDLYRQERAALAAAYAREQARKSAEALNSLHRTSRHLAMFPPPPPAPPPSSSSSASSSDRRALAGSPASVWDDYPDPTPPPPPSATTPPSAPLGGFVDDPVSLMGSEAESQLLSRPYMISSSDHHRLPSPPTQLSAAVRGRSLSDVSDIGGEILSPSYHTSNSGGLQSPTPNSVGPPGYKLAPGAEYSRLEQQETDGTGLGAGLGLVGKEKSLMLEQQLTWPPEGEVSSLVVYSSPHWLTGTLGRAIVLFQRSRNL